jgi:hypothetical protein
MQKQEVTTYSHGGSPIFWQPENGAAVTASDSTILAPGVLFVGTGGNVNVRTRQGTDLVFSNVANGTFLPVVVDMVYSTSTTASDILILR